MMKVNIEAGNDLVMIAKNDIRMIISTPQGVWLYYKNNEEGLLISSNNIESAELFKRVVKAIAYTPESEPEPEPEPRKQREDSKLVEEACCPSHDAEKPTMYRGSLNDEELISWMRSVIRDIERANIDEESIPRMEESIQHTRENLSAIRSRLSKSIKFFDRARLIEPKGEVIWATTSQTLGNGSKEK